MIDQRGSESPRSSRESTCGLMPVPVATGPASSWPFRVRRAEPPRLLLPLEGHVRASGRRFLASAQTLL
jgi:hypothetical protein